MRKSFTTACPNDAVVKVKKNLQVVSINNKAICMMVISIIKPPGPFIKLPTVLFFIPLFIVSCISKGLIGAITAKKIERNMER